MLARSWFVVCLVLLAVSGCSAPPPPPAPPPQAPPPPPFLHAEVWNRTAGAQLVGDSASYLLPRVAMRLDVLRADSATLRVRCAGCERPVEGTIPKAEVVWDSLPPSAAASGDLAELVVAVRSAAVRRDVQALRPVLASTFMSSLAGREGVIETVAAWQRQDFRTLDPLPKLLDRGVSPYGELWVAPPEFLTDPAYAGLRTGFRKGGDGRWEWTFLVRSGM